LYQDRMDSVYNSLPLGEKTDNPGFGDDDPSTKALLREQFAKSLTVLVNKDNIIPVRSLEDIRIALVELNGTKFPES